MIDEQEVLQGIKEAIKLKAIDRVESHLLKPYKDVLIDYDWTNYDDHIKWVATAPFRDILDWCKIVRITGMIHFSGHK